MESDNKEYTQVDRISIVGEHCNWRKLISVVIEVDAFKPDWLIGMPEIRIIMKLIQVPVETHCLPSFVAMLSTKVICLRMVCGPSFYFRNM